VSALPPEVSATLAGRLLVATPLLADGTFDRSVVLVLDHDEDGALGVVVNKATPIEVGTVLPSWQPYVSDPGVLFQGGPVALDSALGLAVLRADASAEPEGWRRVAGRLGLVDLDLDPLDVVGGFDAVRVFAGYAGWSSGQLEDELAEGAWYVVPAAGGDEFSDAFSVSPNGMWRAVLRRQGGDLAMVSTYPDDPTLN
jgi:putative transcriptional regulator